MRLVRWDPFRDFAAYSAWAPVVDIFERGEDLVIRAELPGVSRDAIDVRVENGVLTLQGERKREHELKDETTYRLERSYGAFARSFTLPTTVDEARISATFKDGVLEIAIPKADHAKPKKVEIQAA